MNILDRYVDYWAYVSKDLSDNPYVIGFDPFNEPTPSTGSIQDLFSILLPANFENNQLNPLYERINAKYMEVKPSNIMYFEPDQSRTLFGGYVFHVGFRPHKVGELHHQIMFSMITYTAALSTHPYVDREPADGDAGRCLSWHCKKMGILEKDAKRLGVSLFISEFRACLDSQACFTEIT